MRVIDRGLAVPRRLARWTSDHPFRTAGGVAAAAALGVLWLSLPPTALATPAGAVAALLARPAYLAAVLAGLGLLLVGR
ncbi:MAG: hypothetical protein ABEJ23_07370 [Haloarculaceae archaeon]